MSINQFLFGGTLPSWSLVGQSIGRSLLRKGHQVDFISTDGVKDKLVPSDLKPHVKKVANGTYQAAISYTAMHNFPRYLAHAPHNRLGIWNLDGTVMPPNMVKYHQFCDKLCPSSEFARQTFLRGGVPEEKLVVVPHGIDLEEFQTEQKYPLKTRKSKKILLNIATPHKRKNLKKTLEAYGEAFSKKDDVCLVVKVSGKKQKSKFFVDFDKTLSRFKRKYKKHAEIEVVEGFISSLAELYNSCDIIFMMSHLECFWLPGLEALAQGKLVVASNHGGQLQYLNPQNSLLIDGDVVRMPKDFQYWTPSVQAEMFQPDVSHAAEQLRKAVNQYDSLVDSFVPQIEKTVANHTWDRVTDQMMELVK